MDESDWQALLYFWRIKGSSCVKQCSGTGRVSSDLPPGTSPAQDKAWEVIGSHSPAHPFPLVLSSVQPAENVCTSDQAWSTSTVCPRNYFCTWLDYWLHFSFLVCPEIVSDIFSQIKHNVWGKSYIQPRGWSSSVIVKKTLEHTLFSELHFSGSVIRKKLAL